MSRFILILCMVLLTGLLSSCNTEQEFADYKNLNEFDSYWSEPIISTEGELIGGVFNLYLALNSSSELQYVYFLDNHNYNSVPSPSITIWCDDDSTPHMVIYDEIISNENPNTIDYSSLNQCLEYDTLISVTSLLMSSIAPLPEPLNTTITLEEYNASSELTSLD